jgi:hypothetical protein
VDVIAISINVVEEMSKGGVGFIPQVLVVDRARARPIKVHEVAIRGMSCLHFDAVDSMLA